MKKIFTNKEFYIQLQRWAVNLSIAPLDTMIHNGTRSLTAWVFENDSVPYLPKWGNWISEEDNRNFEATMELGKDARGMGIMSYDTPIAALVIVDNEKFYWVAEGRYSSTTSRHQSNIRRALGYHAKDILTAI